MKEKITFACGHVVVGEVQIKEANLNHTTIRLEDEGYPKAVGKH